jgi:hypothetical protein
MDNKQPSRMDRLLNLLVEEIEERMHARMPALSAAEEPTPSTAEELAPSISEGPAPSTAEEPALSTVEEAPPSAEPPVAETPSPSPPPAHLEEPAQTLAELWAEGEESPPEPEPELPPALPGASHAARLMGRLALGLLVAIVLINIPFNRHGTTLATAMPDSAAVVIRDGLVVKEEDDEEIYVFQDGRFRWISSMDAFEHFGYTWGSVHIVKDGFMEEFEVGTPLHVLLKCRQSPHIYRLEGGEKRWIRDIVTFEAEGHVWDDVRFVSCGHLRNLPDGETIPPGFGPPPQP